MVHRRKRRHFEVKKPPQGGGLDFCCDNRPAMILGTILGASSTKLNADFVLAED